MKKTLLLSVVASTMIMAGGDIAPVEPIVAPVVESGWKFDGNMVAYYQTNDAGTNSLFGTTAAESQNNFGIQLRAVNDDLFWGVGAGFEVTGMASMKLLSGAGAVQATAGYAPDNTGGALTQAYLTYNIEAIDTGLKIGRQTLPKALSPFAFSETWTPVKNTYDAALVVNSSIPDTTLVYAFVDKANNNMLALDAFNIVNPGTAPLSSNGVHMITAQNKSIEGLTLTGSFYYGQELLGGTANDTMIAWGDAKFTYDGYTIGVQGGMVQDKDVLATQNDTTIAYGAKIGAKYNLFDTDFTTCVAYSGVDDGQWGVFNVGGVKTPLYTQMILNQGAIFKNSNTVMGKISADVLYGNLAVAYGMSTTSSNVAIPVAVANTAKAGAVGLTADYAELDVTYKTQITENTELFAAYVMTDDSALTDTQNMVRVWAKYNFK